MIDKKILLVINCIFFSSVILNSQEYLIPLNYNKAVIESQKQIIDKHKKHVLSITSSDLPFFDDFSDSLNSPYPKQSLWTDKNVFINSTYCSDPPSIGVATFDALDNNGKLYSKALTMPTFPADTLTSKSINLSNYNAVNNIYLSFFYQPQGLGSYPDEVDSLTLQFFSPNKNKWDTVWSVPGTYNQPFKLVMLPIVNNDYLQNGFRFRFINYASVNYGPAFPGMSSNGDIWNIDYVYLDKDRSLQDTIRDVAIANPVGSILSHYQAMPWKVFKLPSVFQSEIKDKISIGIRNNDSVDRNISPLTYQVKEVNSKLNPYVYSNSFTMPRDTSFTINEDFLPEALTSESDSSAIFEIKAYLNISELFDRKVNDTVISYQYFSNYYAYDDGSAEYGYGIRGEGSANATVAYEFDTQVEDSLQGVYILFNPVLTYDSLRKFKLRVWSDKNGSPGDSLSGLKDTLPDKNKYGTYQMFLLNKGIAVPKTFYVGWEQTNETFLNIGFDRNRSSVDKIWTNFNQGWKHSKLATEGALMIRPVVGDRKTALLPINVAMILNEKINIYPNPADDFVNIEIPNEQTGSKKIVLFFDITGKIVLNYQMTNQSLNISSLKKGLYIIRVQGNSGQVYNTKLVKK